MYCICTSDQSFWLPVVEGVESSPVRRKKSNFLWNDCQPVLAPVEFYMTLFLCTQELIKISDLSVSSSVLKGLSFSSKGGPKFTKSASIELRPNNFGNKNFMTPHHQYTWPPKQANIVLKSVVLNKINTLSVVILWLTTFWSSKILWPPYFSFQNFMTPSIFGTPHSKKKKR